MQKITHTDTVELATKWPWFCTNWTWWKRLLTDTVMSPRVCPSISRALMSEIVPASQSGGHGLQPQEKAVDMVPQRVWRDPVPDTGWPSRQHGKLKVQWVQINTCMSICTYPTDINTHRGAHWKHLETPPMRTTTNVLPKPNMSCIKITWITFTYDWPHRNFHPDWYNPPYMHKTVQSPTRSHRLWHLRGSTQLKKTL